MALARGPRARVLRLLPELALLLFAGSAAAQTPFRPESGPRDPAVPSVAALRGFETGTGFSLHSEVERVLHGIAAASDRVRIESYGSSVEGRGLWLAWISSASNLAMLDAHRAANLEALAARRSEPDSERPIFVWLSFGAHGDEASSTEAALELLYHLASSRDPAVTGWLDDAVVVIDPLLNPDGHERYVAWFRSVVGPVPDPDPEAREHRPPWPAGRTNHWYFDLNRDWAWGVQPETRARIAAYLATMPQIHVDFHEMDPGSTYFFFPAAPPIHGYYPPSTGEWGRIFGNANAAAFDLAGWPYFTGEDFDLYYPGYGDSWPSFFGATGMTYEQAGGGEAGVVLHRAGDAQLTLGDRVARHLRAALTTIATAVENRPARLADFDAFWGADVRRAPGTPAAWAIAGGGVASEALAELLVRQGIRVDVLAEGSAGRSLTPFAGSGAPDSLPEGTLLVPADQPLGRYAAALLEPDTMLPDTSLFFDITGWSLPYLYDLDAWRVESMPARREAWSPRAPAARRQGDAGVALAWTYESATDAIAAGRMAARGVRVRVSDRPFSVAGRRFPRGSFVVSTGGQPAEAGDAAALEMAVIEAGASPVSLPSFLSDEGIDLGSGNLRLLRVPRIALASGPGTEPTSVGSAWHLLGVEAGLPLDVVRLGDISAERGSDEDSLAALGRAPLDLSAYTAIVLPDAEDPAAYAAALGPEGARRLESWVRAGGTLVAVRAAAAWLADSTTGIADVTLASPPPPPDEERRRAPQRDREVEETRSRIPGTLLAAVVDTTAVLGYGYADGGATVLVRDPTELELAEEGNAWVFADAGARAGYLPTDARRRLAGQPYAIVREAGKGRVIAFADDPAFRGILYGLKKLYLNAALLF
ncbi:MAG TPA: M14 metallopeptidase family protein [Gemmatimonadota bacterium]|nr:M14 metallopeptidase family protein [Gemmatimonadota bacterium]